MLWCAVFWFCNQVWRSPCASVLPNLKRLQHYRSSACHGHWLHASPAACLTVASPQREAELASGDDRGHILHLLDSMFLPQLETLNVKVNLLLK